jgi:sugar/nucleoside kinase (ribokinase family)
VEGVLPLIRPVLGQLPHKSLGFVSGKTGPKNLVDTTATGDGFEGILSMELGHAECVRQRACRSVAIALGHVACLTFTA